MRTADVALTALAVVIWGTTYLVTTEFLPQGYPLTDSLIRALPAGLLLLALGRELPHGIWISRIAILGALNFSVFWWLLFVAAYRLPGGVAGVVIATQPLIVLVLSRFLLATPLRLMAMLAALGGVVGVALLVLQPNAALDPVGIAAGLLGAASMALGTVMARRWQPPVSALTFTAWQLTAGGLELLPFALAIEGLPPAPKLGEALGFIWLGLFGAAISYILWFRGVARLGAAAVSPLVLLSPVTAILLGWIVLDQTLSPVQLVGIALVLGSVWLGQRAHAPAAPAASAAPSGAAAQ